MNKLRLFLGMVLAVTIAASSQELRIAVGIFFSWALGHVLLRRFAFPAGFGKAHNTYIFVTFWLLAAFNNPFYENTSGRLLDIFTRDRFDPDVPGSGFTDWHETYRRRHEEVDSLLATIFWTLSLAFLALFVSLWRWVDDTYTKSTQLSRTITYLCEHGVPPPLPHKQPEVSVSKRDTRYN
ncbi:hypothetical protein Ptr902_11247 [Pyrenophora tritici-repentis]|nr:hypothetical protein Ptr902_11247 [Pyrenophora tritici-repentis]